MREGDISKDTQLRRKSTLNICVPDIQTLVQDKFFVMSGTADTLLSHRMSEELAS